MFRALNQIIAESSKPDVEESAGDVLMEDEDVKSDEV